MKITLGDIMGPDGGAPKGPESTTNARIDLSFRPKEIEEVLKHVGKDARAKSETAVKFRFRGELVVDFEEHRGEEDVLTMHLHFNLEDKP